MTDKLLIYPILWDKHSNVWESRQSDKLLKLSFQIITIIIIINTGM